MLSPVAVSAGVFGGLVGAGALSLVGWGAGWFDHDSGGACAVVTVADRVLPSVVTLSVQTSGGGGTGSGIVYRLSDGRSVVVTNAHVVNPPTGGTVSSVQLTYSDGHTSDATIKGVDTTTDLAVVTPQDTDRNAPAIRVGDSGALRVGTPVVALGAPLGLTSTVTTGIVSATNRYVRVPTQAGAAHLLGAIQTDASINPGNSGGALVDCRSRLVGINSAGAAPGGESGSAGLGFAIPITLARPLIQELAEHGRVAHPTLGLQAVGIPTTMQSTAGGSVGIVGVEAGGPAESAGIQRGDILLSVHGTPIRTPDDLTHVEIGLSVGDSVEVHVLRDGEQKTLDVTVASS
ncbi:S1C family serine protease [Nocardioides nematodiphilus]|uniref:S1C family serine protease n=1 Tax=Nocardioides nematodiphilus TaxID=2849669 RepID=UPI001CD9351A|nr:trypsin-like peptidase domain-containing protein [Nocardioides nematodiphilus]MCA1982237.1 trypsin-like peptidase domain-containing protein [Nocardioides nematodiphilus]